MNAFEAMNVRNNVPALQVKLSRAAKQSLDRRFGALYDKVYREDVLCEAWTRVRANKGAPGIDDLDFETIEQEIGLVVFLTEIRAALHGQRYRPRPVRRCWIDKPGKPEKRPLGIPIIKDRVVQMAVKLVIEPIFETNFLACSYAYRPKRSVQMAVRKIRSEITFGKKTEVVEADIVGCFDNIRHDLLMNLVQRRINDQRLLKLIRSWLRAGVMDGGRWQPPDGLGTPQGGVISPLLCNIYLHSFDKLFKQSKIPGTLVRFADDFVILLWNRGKQVLKQVRTMLGHLGLQLHPAKTRITRAQDGFDFLGIHFRLRPITRPNAKVQQSCAVWPSNRSLQRVKQRVREIIGRRYSLSLEEMISELNPSLRGWANYHLSVQPNRSRLRKLNGFVGERLRIFLRRKYNDDGRGSRRVLGNLVARLGLYQFA